MQASNFILKSFREMLSAITSKKESNYMILSTREKREEKSMFNGANNAGDGLAQYEHSSCIDVLRCACEVYAVSLFNSIRMVNFKLGIK